MKRIHIIIEGRVQGVGFRYYIFENLKNLPVTGFVRNLDNGDVEIIAEAEEELLEKIVNIAKQGPAMSKVINTSIRYSQATGEFNSFEIRR
jgi:acylphosphatase